ncbi:MAG TPA: hypothetical protein VJ995_00385 [Geothermobacteraceae bacterium]|nr:hypothetical protein [Geothermobacteraceae bacterium]
MYNVRAACGNSRCKTKVFSVKRKVIDKVGTDSRPYRIKQVVCPNCRMLAPVTGITEITL